MIAEQSDAETVDVTRKPSRRQQRETRWRETKRVLLEGLRELRADLEPTLASPSLERASLFAYWRADDTTYPYAPDPRRAPDFEDEGDEARTWRMQQKQHEQAVAWRRSIRAARRMKPHNTWRNLGAAGERGGSVAGMSAYPGAWNAYILRVDPDAQEMGGGDGWGGVLGVAFRRIEREQGGLEDNARGQATKLYRALWLMSDPRRPDYTTADLALALCVKRRMAQVWLDAALKRLHAEVETQVRGRERASAERRQAERAEREAWGEEAEAGA